ncbi:MAG TPA: FAD-dependent oxidoreductase [Gemmatimonadales bacterium]|nr:FAD-dependent oxidoreductase [Gemmatimonadales bacterium]
MIRTARPPVAIVGGGLAGLVAAHELRRRGIAVTVYEAGKQVAGLAASFRDEDGFVCDFGAHFITNRLAAALGIGANCRDVRHYGETVFVRGRTYGYPFGLLRVPRYVASAALSRARRWRPAPPASADEWYRTNYGPCLAEEVAIPLVEAWSGVPAAELAPSVIAPQLERGTAHVARLKLASRLSHRAVANGYSREKPESPHVWHVYPEGSLGFLCEHLAAGLGDAVRLESPVEAILVEDGRAVGVRVRGDVHEAAAVVSTAPVHILAKLVKGTDRLGYLARFRYRPMALVNMRFTGRGLLPDVVTWTPARDLAFFRLTEATWSMPWLAPPGKTTINADIGCAVGDAVWTMSDDALGELCVRQLEQIVPDARRRYLGCRVMRTPIAHPIFLREYESEREAFAAGTSVDGLYSIGRNGEFAHILMEDVYWRTVAQMRRLAMAC